MWAGMPPACADGWRGDVCGVTADLGSGGRWGERGGVVEEERGRLRGGALESR